MKNKIACLVLCLFCSSCINAGSLHGFNFGDKIINAINTYEIQEFDGSEEKIKTEHRREHDYVLNKSIDAGIGDAILSDKQFDVDTYLKFVYVPNKKGALQNHYYPMKLDPKEEYKVRGFIEIDNTKYYLLVSPLNEYVFLFDDNGNFYDKAGWIENNRLKLLEEKIFIYPSNLKMQIFPKIREEISNIKDGYEIKYAGAKLDRLWFDYLEYDQDDDNSGGQFERINFPNKPGLIKINGKGLRVIRADENNITFIILTD